MTGSGEPVAFYHYMPSPFLPSRGPTLYDLELIHTSRSIDPPYPVQGGLFHKEAIMLLRRFYIQENEKGR